MTPGSEKECDTKAVDVKGLGPISCAWWHRNSYKIDWCRRRSRITDYCRMSTLSILLIAKSDSDMRRMPDKLSELRLIRSFSISLPMVTYSCGSTTKSAFCDWKKVITSSRARAASSWDGVMDDESVEAAFSSASAAGSGGGCIEWVICVGETDMPSSIAAKQPGSSVMGESRAPLLMNFGVTSSDEPGGDMYCSTPTNIGNVWLRGR
jgi:hypothetical protein